jgi:hypothetical protein
MTSGEPPVHRKARHYSWDGVAVVPYKEDTRALFRSITRQVLFADPQQGSELRYFEVAREASPASNAMSTPTMS